MKYDLKKALEFVASAQLADGGFDTYESYPVVKPEQGWTILPDSSPFITANILLSLLEVDDDDVKLVISKGCQFLQSQKERNGYWRFWPVGSRQHPVPLDADDTSVASYVLEENGFSLTNKQVVITNVDSRGYIYTWFLPTTKLLIKHPLAYFGFLADYRVSRSTIQLQHFAVDDIEPGVAANALLYLGENEGTKRCIDLVIEEILQGDFAMKFYNHPVVVYYHISRAYINSVPSFGKLKETMLKQVESFLLVQPNANEMLKLMAANILLNLGGDAEKARHVIHDLSNLLQVPELLQPQAYFCSRDRNFLAGSPVYTVALYLEAAAKLNSL